MKTTISERDPAGGLTARLRRAGAVTVWRDGRHVPAYYSSVAAELAVCRRSLGIAVRAELDAVHVFGHPAWLDRLLAKALGDRVPAMGRAQRMAATWCARLDESAVLLLGPPASLARWRRLVRGAIATGGLIDDGASGERLAVSLIGPGVERLLAAAGLPADLGAGSVADTSFAGGSAVILRDAADHAFVVLEVDRACDGWTALFRAGHALAVAPVGADAVARLTASRGAPVA